MTTPDELRARVVDAAIRWHTGRENGIALDVGRYILQAEDDALLLDAVAALLQADSRIKQAD